jgi:hypothetical protein
MWAARLRLDPAKDLAVGEQDCPPLIAVSHLPTRAQASPDQRQATLGRRLRDFFDLSHGQAPFLAQRGQPRSLS